MQYRAYGELDGVPNVVVDGSAHADTVLTLSHWPHSGTPPALRDDLSAQIAFHYLDRPEWHVDAEVVSNNHLDQDGLAAMYTLVDPAGAEPRREQLVDLARAGDFGTFRARDSARIAWAIAELASGDAGEGYLELLDRLPELLDHPERYRTLWADEDLHLDATAAALADGAVTITEVPDVDLAVVTVPDGWTPRRVHRFTVAIDQAAHPSAIHNATDRFALLYSQATRYEFEYRYEGWVQYATRRPRPRVDLGPLAEELSADEPGGTRWTFDGVGALAPRMRLHGAEASSVAPDSFRDRLVSFLRSAPPAWDPYD